MGEVTAIGSHAGSRAARHLQRARASARSTGEEPDAVWMGVTRMRAEVDCAIGMGAQHAMPGGGMRDTLTAGRLLLRARGKILLQCGGVQQAPSAWEERVVHAALQRVLGAENHGERMKT